MTVRNGINHLSIIEDTRATREVPDKSKMEQAAYFLPPQTP